MQVRLQIVFGVVLLLFMIAVVHMIRKRYLEIKYTNKSLTVSLR